MTPEQVTQVIRETLYLTLELAAPFLLLALGVGLIIACVQSLTRLQDMTLTVVPKMLAVGGAMIVLFPWVLKLLTRFTSHLIVHGWEKVTHAVHYVLP